MESIKTLMYGWEFPPKISGGLGVACHAIVKELIRKDIKLTLVLPQELSSSDTDQCKLITRQNVSNFSVDENQEYLEIRCPQVASGLHPYARHLKVQESLARVHEFTRLLAQLMLPDEIKQLAWAALRDGQHLAGGGYYAVDLITEVFRYAFFAGTLGSEVEHDVIHAHDWLTALAVVEAKLRSGKPLVLHIHALETDRSGSGGDERIFAIERYGMNYADRIIAVSQYTKENIVRYYGIAPDKISVVHNGVYVSGKNSTSDNARKKNHKMVLFIGRITHQKGPYFFIETAKKVLAKRQDVQFVLAGTGDSMVSMIEHVGELRIGRNVHFTGFLNPSKVQEIYGLADVYVMPSVSEPFGLSALEALSSGVPAVISKQSGVAEVLNHVLVADFWNADDMAAKILALLEYGALRSTMLQRTVEDIELLTWERAAIKIIEVYKSMVG